MRADCGSVPEQPGSSASDERGVGQRSGPDHAVDQSQDQAVKLQILGRHQKVDSPSMSGALMVDLDRRTSVYFNATTFERVWALAVAGAALDRRAGDTFHWRPSSVMTVTVFLLQRVSMPSIGRPPSAWKATRSPILNSSILA